MELLNNDYETAYNTLDNTECEACLFAMSFDNDCEEMLHGSFMFTCPECGNTQEEHI